MKPLRIRWKAFFNSILDPWVVIALIATVGGAVAVLLQSDPVIVAILTLFVSVVSGVLGSILTKNWGDLTEEKIITARGKSAVRRLILLSQSICALEKRTIFHLERHRDSASNTISDTVVGILEEIIEKCRSLRDEAACSIQDWRDIVPEVDLDQVSHDMNRLSVREQEKAREVAELKTALSKKEEQSEQDKRALLKRELELQQVRRELHQKSRTAEILSSSGSIPLPPPWLWSKESQGELGIFENPNLPSLEHLGLRKTCISCGKEFLDTEFDVTLLGSLCPECRDS